MLLFIKQAIPLPYLIESSKQFSEAEQNSLGYAAVEKKKVNDLTEQRFISYSKMLALATGNCLPYNGMII